MLLHSAGQGHRTYLRLRELSFLGFDELLWNAMWRTVLRTDAELPERLAEGRRIFAEEPVQRDLQLFDVRLCQCQYGAGRICCILALTNLDSSRILVTNSETTSSSFLRILTISLSTQPLIIGRLTFVVSTFTLNSGGNLVERSSRWSTLVVNLADMIAVEMTVYDFESFMWCEEVEGKGGRGRNGVK